MFGLKFKSSPASSSWSRRDEQHSSPTKRTLYCQNYSHSVAETPFCNNRKHRGGYSSLLCHHQKHHIKFNSFDRPEQNLLIFAQRNSSVVEGWLVNPKGVSFFILFLLLSNVIEGLTLSRQTNQKDTFRFTIPDDLILVIDWLGGISSLILCREGFYTFDPFLLVLLIS